LIVLDASAAIERRSLPIIWARDDSAHRDAFAAAWCFLAQRIHREPWAPTRVVHCRRQPYDVFVGRPSPWANPFFIGRDGSREDVVQKFRKWIIRQPALLRDVLNLRGRTLGCDCKPMACHGDVLAELADLPRPRLHDAAETSREPPERHFIRSAAHMSGADL